MKRRDFVALLATAAAVAMPQRLRRATAEDRNDRRSRYRQRQSQ
jgi:hypothetical protein